MSEDKKQNYKQINENKNSQVSDGKIFWFCNYAVIDDKTVEAVNVLKTKKDKATSV